jgi:hypothetical protein
MKHLIHGTINFNIKGKYKSKKQIEEFYLTQGIYIFIEKYYNYKE